MANPTYIFSDFSDEIVEGIVDPHPRLGGRLHEGYPVVPDQQNYFKDLNKVSAKSFNSALQLISGVYISSVIIVFAPLPLHFLIIFPPW